ncbi:RNA polymerase sigma-70 factor [Mucilaginibacter sp. RS28]|uniref:RNA polymerase sigma-70 factor n=1 Tax=Mucilaginibacter straminoryzae TaxID=2932774 RepID=A0A9X1X3L9_9SPHI|nr:RNA polymerase sigma-70 factor [Mucilaginibacter straminoryzae]MCJ8209023.1 RNA polymerase sigma-70 factor [Mucilaginibacter straminoryzae]
MLSGQDDQMWPDATLLEMLRSDDQTAFNILYNKYSAKLYYAAYQLFKDQAICEDLVQELFIDLWVKRHQLKINSLEWYLKVAIKNRVLMYLRTKRAELDISAIELLAEKYGADSQLLRNDINRVLDENVASLPEKCRQIFKLSRTQYLSNKEIASMLNISVKTVENQITIALRHLRAGLSDYLPQIAIVLLLHLLN